jgi:hypothetical protein
MRSCKSIKEAYDKLKNKDLASLKSELDVLDKETLPKLRKELKEVEAARSKLETRKSYADQIQTDVILIDKFANECSEIDRKIEACLRKNPTIGNDGLDLAQLNEEKKELNDELNK